MTENHDEVIYQQYWSHARHSEQQLWSITSIYSAIITAIFAAVGAGLHINLIISISSFGFILSILGFLLVFTLRLSFVRFVCLAEVIAINELGLKNEYRRFYPPNYKRLMPDKPISEPDILSVFYSLIASIMVYISLNLVVGENIVNCIISVIVFSVLFIIHWFGFRKKYNRVWDEIKIKIKHEQNQPDEPKVDTEKKTGYEPSS